MPIILPKKLILIGAKQISFTDQRTGKQIDTWKYQFIDKDLKFVNAYDETGLYRNDVQTVTGWDETKAKDFTFLLREYNGETKMSLLVNTKGGLV